LSQIIDDEPEEEVIREYVFGWRDVKEYACRAAGQSILEALGRLLDRLDETDLAVNVRACNPGAPFVRFQIAALKALARNTDPSYEWLCTRDVLVLQDAPDEDMPD
jgi:hypothetical protein